MKPHSSPSPPLAVAGIIMSMGLVAIGNGLLFAFIPVKLAAEGFPPWIAGALVTAACGGGIVGCLCTGWLIRRVGHARIFATLAAVTILATLLITVGTDPLIWIISRVAYGVSVTGLFIVAQSWLNDAAENEWRGKIIAVFYMTYVVGIGTGAFLLTFVSLDGQQAPLLAVACVTLGILPVSLTRLRTPPPPERVSIAIAAVWKISPVGLVGLLSVGGLTMMVQGFAPIYATAENYSKDQIGLLMLLMQAGMIFVQLPLGAISDRTDRRYVLVAACLIVAISASVAAGIGGAGLFWLILVFAVWGGATESIYGIATAHANDRADPQYYVSLSSTLLIAWSVSGFVLPGLATILTELVGIRAFMFVTIAVALAYGGFVAFRLSRRDPVPDDRSEPYQPISAQAPLTAELAPLPTRD